MNIQHYSLNYEQAVREAARYAPPQYAAAHALLHEYSWSTGSGSLWLWLWCGPYKSCSDFNSQPKRPLATLTFDLESGVRVTCGVGYLTANLSLPRPLCSQS